MTRNFIIKLALLIALFNDINRVNGVFYYNCDDNPCQHGECLDLYRKTAYRCECNEGWEGENCDQSLTPNNLPNEIVPVVPINTNSNKENNWNNNIDSDSVSKKPTEHYYKNPCDNIDCKNGGICNERHKICDCHPRFTGDFCEYSSLSADNVYDDIHVCEKRCDDKLDKVGSTCNYKENDSLQSCKCGMFKINKEHGNCLPVLNNHETCQEDCSLNTNFKLNETRICHYFDKTHEVNTCSCTEGDDSCVDTELYKQFEGLVLNVQKYFGSFKWLIIIIITIVIFNFVIKRHFASLKEGVLNLFGGISSIQRNNEAEVLDMLPQTEPVVTTASIGNLDAISDSSSSYAKSSDSVATPKAVTKGQIM